MKMIRKIVYLYFTLQSFAGAGFANQSCFLVQEQNKDIIREGDCTISQSPCSTFKPVLAVMGFDAGVLTDAQTPKVTYDSEKHDGWLPDWRQDQTPTTYMKYSCLWYSLYVVDRLGRDQVQRYLADFKYGNQALRWKNKTPWIMGSLKVSAEEQIQFFKKLNDGQLPVKPDVLAKMKDVMFVQDLQDGWQLYGKTGMATNGMKLVLNWIKGKDGLLAGLPKKTESFILQNSFKMMSKLNLLPVCAPNNM